LKKGVSVFVKISFIVLLFFSDAVFAQNAEGFKPDSVKKEIEAVRITSSLHIDGVLNDAEWQKAKPSPRFTQIEPLQGSTPHFETEVKALYNKQYLYFGIFARDSLGKKAIRATDFKGRIYCRQTWNCRPAFQRACPCQ